MNDKQFAGCFESNFNRACPEMCDQRFVSGSKRSTCFCFLSITRLTNYTQIISNNFKKFHGFGIFPGLKFERQVSCTWPKVSHDFLSPEMYAEHKGHLVALFRQPEQRLLSQYYDTNELFRAAPFISICAENRTPARIMEIDEFIGRWASWATAQITGSIPPTKEDIPLALKRLREGFAFVGLQEEWELSICLFHAKFGGPCRPVEFLDTRPSDQTSNTSSEYDTSVLNGWVDDIDGPIYAEAQSMFYEDLTRFGVSHETCQACYQEAGLK